MSSFAPLRPNLLPQLSTTDKNSSPATTEELEYVTPTGFEPVLPP